MQSKPKTIEIQGRVTKSYIFTLADGSLLAKVTVFTDNKVSCKEHTLTIRESEICPREKILAIKKKDVIHATGEKRLLTAPTNEFVGFYSIAPNGAIGEYRDSPSRSMFSAALPSRS